MKAAEQSQDHIHIYFLSMLEQASGVRINITPGMIHDTLALREIYHAGYESGCL